MESLKSSKALVQYCQSSPCKLTACDSYEGYMEQLWWNLCYQPWVSSTFFSLHTSQFLFNLFFHFLVQALAVWSYVIFCHTGHVSSLRWSMCSSMGRNIASCKSLISFLSLLQNQNKNSSHLSPPFPLLLFFIGSTKIEQRMQMVWGINSFFLVKYENTSVVHFFPPSIQARLCQAWTINISCFSEHGGISFYLPDLVARKEKIHQKATIHLNWKALVVTYEFHQKFSSEEQCTKQQGPSFPQAAGRTMFRAVT